MQPEQHTGTQRRGQLSPEEGKALLASAGVTSKLLPGQSTDGQAAVDGLLVDRRSLVRALADLQDTDQLPWKLTRSLEQARDGAVHIKVEGQLTDVSGSVSALGVGYLIGLPGDRAECLERLWVLHVLWQQAKGLN